VSIESRVESYITTDGQSASLSWHKAPVWVLRPDFYYCQTFVGLLMWGALSDERAGLPFTITAGPRQRSYSRVRVLLDSWPYFTVSDTRLSILSSPTTRRVTVEVVGPATTRECVNWVSTEWHLQSQSHIATDRQSVSPGVEPHLLLMTRYLLLFDSCVLVFVGRPLWREDWSILYMLLAIASIVFLESMSLGTRDHILLSQILDFPVHRLLRLVGSRWRYSTPPPKGCTPIIDQIFRPLLTPNVACIRP
jgi:hypothetical protein